MATYLAKQKVNDSLLERKKGWERNAKHYQVGFCVESFSDKNCQHDRNIARNTHNTNTATATMIHTYSYYLHK